MGFLKEIRILIVLLVLSGIGHAATPPSQPPEGPGSSGDATIQVLKRTLGEEGAVTYAFFTADSSRLKPVVVFFHPWGLNDPQAYGTWFNQLARRGYLVLFPRYQEMRVTETTQTTQRARELIRRALMELKSEPALMIDTSRVAYIGHLAGAVVAVNLAADSANKVQPQLIFGLMPGGIARDAKSTGIPLADLSEVSALTSVVMMSADRASTATDRTAKQILHHTMQVSYDRKLYIKVFSDAHGYPTLSATLMSPGAPNSHYAPDMLEKPAAKVTEEEEIAAPAGKGKKGNRQKKGRKRIPPPPPASQVSGEQAMLAKQIFSNRVDPLDYYAYWKTFEMLANMAFAGGELALLQNDPEFVGMGIWSDGFPVKRLRVEVLEPPKLTEK